MMGLYARNDMAWEVMGQVFRDRAIQPLGLKAVDELYNDNGKGSRRGRDKGGNA